MAEQDSTRKPLSSGELQHFWEKYLTVRTGPHGPLFERIEAVLKDGTPDMIETLGSFVSEAQAQGGAA